MIDGITSSLILFGTHATIASGKQVRSLVVQLLVSAAELATCSGLALIPHQFYQIISLFSDNV